MTSDWKASVGDVDRLSAVARSGLAELSGDDVFDGLLDLAIEVTGAPRGCLTLVDSTHTSAFSASGFPEDLVLRAPIQLSFCRFVVSTGRPFLVEDAHADPRTVGDPTIEAFGAVAWLGYPIEDAEGMALGTFCLMDPKARDWTSRDIQVVATLAQAVSTEIALRAARAQLRSVQRRLDEMMAGTRGAAQTGSPK